MRKNTWNKRLLRGATYRDRARSWVNEYHEHIREMIGQGLTFGQIAHQYNLRRVTLCQRLAVHAPDLLALRRQTQKSIWDAQKPITAENTRRIKREWARKKRGGLLTPEQLSEVKRRAVMTRYRRPSITKSYHSLRETLQRKLQRK